MSDNEIRGLPGFKGPVGTAPHIGLREEVWQNIQGARTYGDALFRWKMAKMEEEEAKGREGNSNYTHWLDRVESFDEDFYKEMKNHFNTLARPGGTGIEFSEKDRESYKEMAKLFDFLGSLIN